MKKLLTILLVCTASNSISPSLSETDLDDEIREICEMPKVPETVEKYQTVIKIDRTYRRVQPHKHEKQICPDECCKFLESFCSIVKGWVISNDHKNQ